MIGKENGNRARELGPRLIYIDTFPGWVMEKEADGTNVSQTAVAGRFWCHRILIFPLRKNIHFAGHDSRILGRIGWEAVSHFTLIDVAGSAAAAPAAAMAQNINGNLIIITMRPRQETHVLFQIQHSTGGLRNMRQ